MIAHEFEEFVKKTQAHQVNSQKPARLARIGVLAIKKTRVTS